MNKIEREFEKLSGQEYPGKPPPSDWLFGDIGTLWALFVLIVGPAIVVGIIIAWATARVS